jgi:hypothetical protein
MSSKWSLAARHVAAEICFAGSTVQSALTLTAWGW